MSSQTFSTFSEVGMIDARSQNGIITLPLSTDIPYRILTLKDIYGASALSSITLITQGTDVFEDGTTSRLLNGAFETTTLYAGQAGSWYTTGGSRLATAAIGSVSTGLIQNSLLRLGTLSTQTAIQFPGLRSNYTGTVVAGQTTGVGTQELLLYQASTTADQIRLQTTGNIVFEAGVSARLWPSTQAVAIPTLYIAGSSSNVGIGTGTPAATLDVAGTGRFQTLSTLAFNVSSINGAAPGGVFSGSTVYLSAGIVQAPILSTLALNVSSINGAAPGGVFSGSTLYLSAGIVQASILSTFSLNVSSINGLALPTQFVGSTNYLSAGTVQTQTLSTFTLTATNVSSVNIQSQTVSTLALTISSLNGQLISQPITSTMLGLGTAGYISSAMSTFSTLSIIGKTLSAPSLIVNISSQVGLGISTPLAQLHLFDLPSYTLTTPPMMIFDRNATSVVSANYTYLGDYIYFTVPSAVYSITMYMWGAGGGGGNGTGGGGAFTTGTVLVTPGQQVRMIVGKGGAIISGNTQTDAQGGGGGGGVAIGGGRTAIQLNIAGTYTEVLTAGGGGGAGSAGLFTATGGNAYYTGTSQAGQVITYGGTTGGGGGSSTAGGTSGTGFGANGVSGTQGFGGSALSGGGGGGGGGGGYYGGAGGGSYCGGGGGGSYNNGTYVTNFSGVNGNSNVPIATTVSFYQTGAGQGGAAGVAGSNGLIGIQYNGFREADYIDFNRAGVTVATITSQGALALGKASVASGYQLDVAGNVNIAGTFSTTQALYASSVTTSLVSTFAINVSTINGQTVIQPINSTMIGLGTVGYLSSLNNLSTVSTLNLNVSTINGQTLVQPINSTMIGLGTVGYISTSQLTSTVSGLVITAAAAFTGSTILLSAGTINVSTVNSYYVSSVQGYFSSLRTDNLTVGGPTGYVTIQDLTTGTVSTGQIVAGAGFISSLQINTLSFGPSGYVIIGDVIANSLSTKKLNTQNLYANNLYLGNISTQSALLFPGLDGNFKGTAVAEQATGPGTEELLLYKVSTTTDQIRLQTTGNIVFEAGVPQRSWPSTQMLATPTLYIQGSTSNIGVGTATPAATLDVVGQGRFQILSTLTLNTSTINGIIPGAAFNGSTTSLSSAIVTVSSLAVNTVKVSTVLVYSTINLLNNPLTNIYSALFAPTYSGTINPNASAGGIYSTYTSGTNLYALHVFTTIGTTSFVPAASITGAQVLIIAGGGSGGTNCAGGGGAGGLVYLTNYSIASGSYSFTVGGGGIGNAVQGSNSIALGFTANGGGAGGTNNGGAGQSGGCGGGGSASSAAGGSATQTSIAASPYPGYAGGTAGNIYGGAGGGGMGSIGSNGSGNTAGNGGNGLSFGITGTSLIYCGGGGGGTYPAGSIPGTGGTGGGGNGGTFVSGTGTNGSNATYYGGGGGGGSGGASSGSGGSGYQGIVIVAYTINQFGSLPFTVGTITGDATSNLSIQPVNNLSLVGTTQITGLLAASSISTTYITAASISTGALQVSSINGQTVGGPIQSTVIGLGSAGYVSTANLLGHVSTANLLGLVSTQNLLGHVSTANLLGLVSTTYLTTQLQSTVDGLGSVNYISSASLISTTRGIALQFGTSSISSAFITATQGYISSLIVDSLFTASGTFSTPQMIVSSINGYAPVTMLTLTSTVAGTNSNISSMIDPVELASTITGLGTIGFVSSIGLTNIMNSTVIGLNTYIAAAIDPIELASSIVGLGTMGFISSIGFDAKFGSTVQGLGSAGYISSLTNVQQLSTLNINISTINGQTLVQPIQSTVMGLGLIGYASTSYVKQQLSSLSTAFGSLATGGGTFVGSTIYLSAAIIQTSTISSFLITTGSLYTPSISTNAIVFGTGTGTLLMPDIAPNTLYTSTVTASNIQVGWSSNQSPIQFYGFGTYSNSVIVEQSTGTTTQELLMFRGSNAADRIRLQTTGYLSIETGVSSRLFPNTGSNVLPTMMIDINSNVGILLSTPVFSLDVGSTLRAVALSTLYLQTSTIQGATFTKNLYVNNASTFLMDEVSTSFLQGNYNSLILRTAGTQRAVLTQAGFLGVGITNPQYSVDITGTTRLSTLYYSTSISYNMISAPFLMASTVNTANVQVTNVSTAQINTSTIYGRWNDAQYYVLQTL